MKTLVFCFALALPLAATAQSDSVRFEMSFSGMATLSDGTLESSLFVRASRPLWRALSPELSLGVDHRRKTATFIYDLALRVDWPQPGWTPFALAGFGAESLIVGPFLTTRPLFTFGAGALIPIVAGGFIRAEYQLQHVRALAYPFNRHYFLIGIQLRWKK